MLVDGVAAREPRGVSAVRRWVTARDRRLLRPVGPDNVGSRRSYMSTHGAAGTSGMVGAESDVRRRRHNTTRLARTETKAAFKTTEMIAGAIEDGFGARTIWLYATILTVGYMISRGLAKSGSTEPYRDDDNA